MEIYNPDKLPLESADDGISALLEQMANLEDDHHALVDAHFDDINGPELLRLERSMTNARTFMTIALGLHPAAIIAARTKREERHPRYPGKWWTSAEVHAVFKRR